MGSVRKCVALCFLSFLFVLLGSSNVFAQGFAAAGSLNTARWAHTGTTLQDGRVFIAGGFVAGGDTSLTAEVFDPSTNTSSVLPDLNTSRARHTATLLKDGRVLIVGGINVVGGIGNAKVTASAEIFTPATNTAPATITVTGSLNRARENHTATLLNDGTVLIAGGLDNNANVSYEAEIYDPSTGNFTSIANLKKDRESHTATLLANGQVLIAGGADSASPLTSAELYDPASRTFSFTGNLNDARALHSATLLPDGTVLIAGGSGSSSILQTAEIYNATSGTFSPTGSLSTPRSIHTATALLSGQVLLAGGTGQSTLDPTGDLYDPVSGTFTATGAMVTPRQNHTASLLPSGQVLIAGGEGIGAPGIANNETYAYPLESGTINPKYIVVAVGYAPPGAKSSVTYQQSTQFGTSTSLDQTFTNGTSVSVAQTVGFSIKSDAGSTSGGDTTTASTSYTETSEQGSSIAVNKTTQLTQGILGPANSALAVDHDFDKIYVWLNPKVNLSLPDNQGLVIWNGYTYDSRDPINDVDVVGISVTCLKDFNSADPGCTDNNLRLSRSWDTSGLGGLTAADYQNILARDPFAANPTYDPTVPDSTGVYRFQRQTGVNLDYTPAVQGAQPAPAGYTVNTSTTTTANQSATDTYSVNLSVESTSSSSFVLDISNKLTVSNTTTWVNKWSQTNTAVNGNGIAVSITPPASTDNYYGPTAVEVWQDNVYGTIMFYMDPGSVVQPPGDFSITATPNTITAPQGQQSDLVQIGVTGINGFTRNVTFAVSGLPTGVTVIPPNGTSVQPGQLEPIVFVATADAPLGTTNVTITGTAGTLTHTVTVALTVTTPPPPDAITITIPPASQTVTVGSIAEVLVTASTPPEYTDKINVSLQNLPAGVMVSPASASLTPGVPQTFVLIAGQNALPATSTVTVFGQDNSVNGSASLSLTVVASPTALLDAPTWHYNTARTGLYSSETSLTPTNVTASNFGKTATFTTDAAVDAQPLFLSGLTIGAQAHDVLYTATENDTVYAWDVKTKSVLWQKSAIGSGETASDNQGCSELSSTVGITSTPVIDRYFAPDGAIYFVAKTKDGSGNYHQRLHALDLTTGAELTGSPVEITATYPSSGGTNTFDPSIMVEQAALLLSNGTVYLSWAAPCHQTTFDYQSWVMAYSEATLAQQSVLDLTPNGNGGGIWMSGAGPAADADGNVFLITSEGTFDTTLDGNGYPVNGDYGNGYVKIQPTNGVMSLFDYFEPLNGVQASATNYQDQGSGGVLLVPDIPIGNGNVMSLSVGAGKDGNIYYMGRTGDFLGEYDGQNDNNIYTISNALANGASSTPAYFNQTLFYGGIGDSVKAIDVLGTNTTSQSANTLGPAGATPVVSANGTSTPVVWALDTTASGGPVLYAYDATDLTHELYDSTQAQVGELPRDTIGKTSKHAVPVVANGFVYIGTDAGLTIFGLLP